MSRGDVGIPRSHFLVLLSLADASRHGLGIVEEVEARTGGAVKMGPGTLYGTLKRLAADGLIAETATPPDPDNHDSRRKYYDLTATGRATLAEEASVLRDLVSAVRDKDVLPEGGR